MIDQPYYVVRAITPYAEHTIQHTSDGYVASVKDIVLAHHIIDLLNADERLRAAGKPTSWWAGTPSP